MYSGTVVVTSKILNPGIQFNAFEFDTGHPNIAKAELASKDGKEITSTITLDQLSSGHELLDIAKAVHKKAMIRLTCLNDLVAAEATCKVIELNSSEHPGSTMLLGSASVSTSSSGHLSVILIRTADEIRKVVERPLILADVYFELFDQARNSSNEVVEFLGYYQIVSSVLNEPGQKAIDDFLLKHGIPRPTVTPKPNKDSDLPSKGVETIYSRLRNQIAHVRIDPMTKATVKMSVTKAEISHHVSGLRRLARIAIQQAITGAL